MNDAHFARLEERIDGQRTVMEEKLSGTSKAIYILLEVATKAQTDNKDRIGEISELFGLFETKVNRLEAERTREINRLKNEIENVKANRGSKTQIRVAQIGALGACLVALITAALSYLQNH